jgi:hypothetical protein
VIYATGIGNIELWIAGGHTLKLIDALYIPASNVCLVSILALNKSGNYTTHFDSSGCWVTNKSNTTLVHGTLSTSKCLYVLSKKMPYVQHQKQAMQMPNTLAFYTNVPDIETWHCHLGHCNARTIVDMAKNGVTQGMPIDLSSLPVNCDHCALGKQSRSPVPKTQEGKKADRHLERVYADLCEPMAITSRAGHLYTMNMIDNFSGYVWCVPLQSKADVCAAIQIWHKAVTVQSGNVLKILITSKLYAQSDPCILIGYALHSKAYRLWEPSLSHVFNSYHVKFTKHLDAKPSSFLPGKTFGTEDTSTPPSWDSSGIPPPPDHPLPTNHPFSNCPKELDPPSPHETL